MVLFVGTYVAIIIRQHNVKAVNTLADVVVALNYLPIKIFQELNTPVCKHCLNQTFQFYSQEKYE